MPQSPSAPLSPTYARSKIAASSWLIKNGTNHLPRKIGQIVSPTLKSFQNELCEEEKFQYNEIGFKDLILGIQINLLDFIKKKKKLGHFKMGSMSYKKH